MPEPTVDQLITRAKRNAWRQQRIRELRGESDGGCQKRRMWLDLEIAALEKGDWFDQA